MMAKKPTKKKPSGALDRKKVKSKPKPKLKKKPKKAMGGEVC